MAKKPALVKISGINESRDNIRQFIQKQLNDEKLLQDLGQTAADQIRNRTRARLEDYKQPELKPSTQARRKSLIAAGNAFDERIVKAKRSNLSLTGQLLDAISYRVNNTAATITLFIRRPRLALSGLRKDKLANDKDNVQIKNELLKMGREFFFISDRLKAQLESKIAQAIRQKLSLYRQLKSKLK